MWRTKERSGSIKKILFIIYLFWVLLSPIRVKAIEESDIDVTNDIEIRYRWYKEIISSEGEYYPLKEITKEDRYDSGKIKYVGKELYSADYCSLPDEYYKITEKYMKEYNRVYNATYMIIENVSPTIDIKIYYHNQPVNYKIVSSEDNQLKINLAGEYACDRLLFFVDTNEKYKISLYRDSDFQILTLSKEIENNKVSVPDAGWITDETKFYIYATQESLQQTSLTKFVSERAVCSYKEKYVYKYDVTREYYDDDYHSYIDGYIKDINNYRYYYKGEPIVNTIEITKEKVIKEPQIKYVYLEPTINTKENDSSFKQECSNETITKTKTQVQIKEVEKPIFKIPKAMYIIIGLLSLLIIILITKLYKKMSTKENI